MKIELYQFLNHAIRMKYLPVALYHWLRKIKTQFFLNKQICDFKVKSIPDEV